jgi:hypothetical protein
VLAIGPTAIAGMRRPARLGLPFTRSVRLSAQVIAVEPQQSGYLSHSDAAAALVDRFPQRQTFIVSHRPQRLPSAPLSVPDDSSRSPSAVSTSTARASSRRSRLGPFLAPVLLGHLTLSAAPLALLTADSSHLPYRPPALYRPGPSLSRKRMLMSSGHHRRSQPASRTPQPIPRSDVPHTSCILGCSLRAGDVPGPATSPGRLNLLLPTGEVRPGRWPPPGGVDGRRGRPIEAWERTSDVPPKLTTVTRHPPGDFQHRGPSEVRNVFHLEVAVVWALTLRALGHGTYPP